MIDPQTTWAILVTPLGITAGLGWIRCARMLAAETERADGQAAGWELAAVASEKHRLSAQRALGELGLSRAVLAKVESESKAFRARAIDAEDRLRKIERQRSDTTRKGNLTKSANRKAAIAATTAKLREELQAAQPAERMAA